MKTETEIRYSQQDEEAWILAAVGDIKDGRFLDVGAYHPKVFSNTRALYERGWSGVMIEPAPGPLRDLVKEYGNDPRVTIIGAAMGVADGLLELAVTDDAVSTSDFADGGHYKEWEKTGGYYGKLWAPQLRWQQVFLQFGKFDFINLDAEGLSVWLLQDLFATTLARPKCICIEHDNRHVEIMQTVGAEYHMVTANGTNAILVHA